VVEGAAAGRGIRRAGRLSTAKAINLQRWRTSVIERIAELRRTSRAGSEKCHNRTHSLQHDRHKKKDRLAAAFPKFNPVGAWSNRRTVRSLKLDHINASQRDLVNDRIRQSVSRNLILVGVITRHSIYRHDYVKATQ
jgi:hypothetical protein